MAASEPCWGQGTVLSRFCRRRQKLRDCLPCGRWQMKALAAVAGPLFRMISAIQSQRVGEQPGCTPQGSGRGLFQQASPEAVLPSQRQCGVRLARPRSPVPAVDHPK